jgi:hypothetical protein
MAGRIPGSIHSHEGLNNGQVLGFAEQGIEELVGVLEMLEHVKQNYQVEFVRDKMRNILDDEVFGSVPLIGDRTRMAGNLDAKALPASIGC